MGGVRSPIVWAEWARLVEQEPVGYCDPSVRWAANGGGLRDPGKRAPRDQEHRWPPEGARHDGIEGQALRSMWPAGCHAGGIDRKPEVIAAAELDLRALDLFRAAIWRPSR